jgi:hypothetical protein
MQKVACEANAIKKLAEIILSKQPVPSGYEDISTHHIDKLKEVPPLPPKKAPHLT